MQIKNDWRPKAKMEQYRFHDSSMLFSLLYRGCTLFVSVLFWSWRPSESPSQPHPPNLQFIGSPGFPTGKTSVPQRPQVIIDHQKGIFLREFSTSAEPKSSALAWSDAVHGNAMGLPLHYEDVFGLRTPNRDSFQPFITVPTLTGGCGRTFGLPAVSSTKGSLDSFAGPAAPHSSDGIHLGWWGEAQNPVSLGWVDVGLMCFLVGAFKHVLLHILSPFGMKTTPDWLHIYEMGCAFQLASMVFFHFFSKRPLFNGLV